MSSLLLDMWLRRVHAVDNIMKFFRVRINSYRSRHFVPTAAVAATDRIQFFFSFFFLKKTNNEQTDVSFLFYFFLSFFCQQQSVLRMSMQVRKRNLAFTHRTVWTLESINESHENEFTHIIISSHIIVISFAHFFFRSFCVLLP